MTYQFEIKMGDAALVLDVMGPDATAAAQRATDVVKSLFDSDDPHTIESGDTGVYARVWISGPLVQLRAEDAIDSWEEGLSV